MNPARGRVTGYRPARITIAMLTYIPHLEGYYRSRFEILKLSIASLRAHTTQPHDLVIFDNGSCSTVLDYLNSLKDAGEVDYLLLSSGNIGKIGAFRVLFNAAPGEIIAYTDDDIYFYPGWLEAHLEILDTYPGVGMVSGSPIRDEAERASTALKGWIAEDPPGLAISMERRIADEWEVDWANSVGRDPQTHLQSTRGHNDLILNFGGVEAFGSASHFQFVTPKDVILQALPEEWSGKLMGDMIALDEAVDALGCLRLSTVDRFTRHLGNEISPDLAKEAGDLGLNVERTSRQNQMRRHWLLRIPGSGRLLRWVYDLLFRLLHNVK